MSEHIDWMADRIVPRCEGKNLLIVFNKAESLSADDRAVLEGLYANIDALGSIVGEVSSDEVLANIFSKFCIGK